MKSDAVRSRWPLYICLGTRTWVWRWIERVGQIGVVKQNGTLLSPFGACWIRPWLSALLLNVDVASFSPMLRAALVLSLLYKILVVQYSDRRYICHPFANGTHNHVIRLKFNSTHVAIRLTLKHPWWSLDSAGVCPPHSTIMLCLERF